ncbi:MAG: AbrB/MazE/SpoVT family DNA-binding domain-containing protein [Candidatus Promineifilaceae bacterium]|nr:AbrB/MazE/SpoVT family DNA-binding domain-containing protein [Candidatus Promineifilaceae bacterium]
MVGSKITSKGQTTIPKRIRERLQLEPGDRVLFVEREDEIVLQPVKHTLLDLKGSVEPRQSPEDFEKIRGEVKKRVVERRARH